jgi:hypothetical protein
MGAISVVAAGVSMVAISLLGRAGQGLSQVATPGPVGWTGVHLAGMWLSFLPAAAGLTALFLVSSVLRAGTRHDAFADCSREWMAAAATGITALGLARLAGLNLMAVGPVMGLAGLVLAASWWMRTDFDKRPGRLVRPVKRPSGGGKLRLAGVFAGLSAGLGLQVRLLADVAGASLGVQALWVALALLLVVRFQAIADAKGRMPGRRQCAGCMIGIAAGLIGQMVLAGMALISPLHLWLCGAFAVGIQGPLAAMAAVLISRQRQAFVNEGARPRDYLAQSGLGIAAGVLLLRAAWASPVPLAAILTAWLVLAGGGFVVVLLHCKRSVDLVRWLATGLAVMLLLAAEIGLARARLTREVGRLEAGAWLTTATRWLPCGVLESQVLPPTEAWRSERISELALEAMGGTGASGRWWIVATRGEHVTPSMPPLLRTVVGAPDPAAVGAGPWREQLAQGPRRDWLRGVWLGQGQLDGIALAGPPVDHPGAWRVFRFDALARAAGQLRRGAEPGPLLVRTQSHSGQVADVLALAVTYARAVGSGYLAITFLDEHVDLLLVGPADAVEPPAPLPGVFVVDLDALERTWPGVRPIRSFDAPGPLSPGPDVPEFVRRLKTLSMEQP